MSFDIYLKKDDEVVEVQQRHWEGGTYSLNGSDNAHLNVTYNYSKFYYETICKETGFRWLYRKKAIDTTEKLITAIQKLGCQKYTGEWWVWKFNIDPTLVDFYQENKKVEINLPENEQLLNHLRDLDLVYNTGGYWKPDPGNAGYALTILLQWGLEHPDGIWDGD